MVSTFNSKIFCSEAKYTLTELGRIRQYLSEDLDLYAKRFHGKALDYSHPIIEEVLAASTAWTIHIESSWRIFPSPPSLSR